MISKRNGGKINFSYTGDSLYLKVQGTRQNTCIKVLDVARIFSVPNKGQKICLRM